MLLLAHRVIIIRGFLTWKYIAITLIPFPTCVPPSAFIRNPRKWIIQTSSQPHRDAVAWMPVQLSLRALQITLLLPTVYLEVHFQQSSCANAFRAFQITLLPPTVHLEVHSQLKVLVQVHSETRVLVEVHNRLQYRTDSLFADSLWNYLVHFLADRQKKENILT